MVGLTRLTALSLLACPGLAKSREWTWIITGIYMKSFWNGTNLPYRNSFWWNAPPKKSNKVVVGMDFAGMGAGGMSKYFLKNIARSMKKTLLKNMRQTNSTKRHHWNMKSLLCRYYVDIYLLLAARLPYPPGRTVVRVVNALVKLAR